MNKTIRANGKEARIRSSFALDAKNTSPDYLESEARSRIGILYRTNKPVHGIAGGKIGRVVDVDKIRIYRARTPLGSDCAQVEHLTACTDAWHLTLEWNDPAAPPDVFRKSEVEQYLSRVN